MSEEHIQRMLAQKAIRDGIMAHQQQNNTADFGGEEGANSGGLGGMCGRIEAFLAEAANAPAPHCLETSDGSKRRGDNKKPSLTNEDEREIQLNLILGVFEERKAAMAAAADGKTKDTPHRNGGNDRSLIMAGNTNAGASRGNILLPSQQAEEMLYAEKLRDSHAVLSMFSALADTRGDSGASEGARRKKNARQLGSKGARGRTLDEDDDDATNDDGQRCAEQPDNDGAEEEEDDNVESSDDEVVFMDYDEEDTSSDDEDIAAKAKALLFGGGKRPLIEEM